MEAFQGIADFSHVWILFLFHKETSAIQRADDRSPSERTEAQPADFRLSNFKAVVSGDART